MKLIVTVVDGMDVDSMMSALIDQHIRVTRVSSTSDFFSPGNSTLLIGVDEKAGPQVMKVIADLTAPVLLLGKRFPMLKTNGTHRNTLLD